MGLGLWGRAEQQDFRSRVRGTLLGAALGDALGAPAARETHGPHGRTGPQDRTDAAGPVGPITGVGPVGPAGADGLVGPYGSTHPADPTSGVGLASPVGPVSAAGPDGLVGPQGPAHPVAPVSGVGGVPAHGGPARTVGPGRLVTAGTQLSLFTADGLIRAHVRRDTGAWHPPTDIHRAYLRWAATQRDWGPDERRRDNGWLGAQEWLYARRSPDRASLTGFADDILGTLDRPKNPTARGAAAAARSAPFGLLVGWEPALVLQLATECAAQSHGHPGAYLTAGAFAVIVHGLTRGDSLDAAIQRTLGLLGSRAGHQGVTDALQRAVAAVPQGPPSPESVAALASAGGEGHPEGHAEGHAEDALAVAVYCALVAEDVPHGLRLAVTHEGDPASASALCGALLGALHGETALPGGWLAVLEGRATLLELADDFALEMTQGPSLHGPAASGSGSGWTARYPVC
ncbi:ADP-ribosylglycohydrolase family protein [Streptomyces sp. NPDC086989]|uniref:ADP-ribosylglycohydrolase family protein n=1 Tax=Streptomyces sp. NPDC086989 TaxID=3365764 RepID=UPI0037FA3F93